jgi:hypothetical protein
MGERQNDDELVDAFLSQEDRYTHSGLLLSDCFSQNHFDLVFAYGTVVQKSAVRHALIACLSLPSFDPMLGLPPRNETFEKHLENLVLYALRSIVADTYVARDDRALANELLEAVMMRAGGDPGAGSEVHTTAQSDSDHAPA